MIFLILFTINNLKTERNKIILFLFTPPPFGGGEMQGLILQNYFCEKENFIIYTVSRERKSKLTQGNVTIKNILFGFTWIYISIKKIIKHKPGKVFIILPQNFFPLLRNSVLIYFCKYLKIKIFAELPGTSFIFLDNKKFPQYNIGLSILKKIDDIRFLSESIKNLFLKYNFKKLSVIENGISIPENLKVNDDVFTLDTLNLLYVGSLEFSKGLLNIFKFLKIADENKLNVKMNLIGEWRYEEEKSVIDDFLKKNDISNYFVEHGLKYDDSKWEIVKKCAILLHPTFWDGVPFSILEAMGTGLAIVSTNVGGIPDTVTNGENGILLKENSPEKIFDSINYYYNNRDLLKEISKNNIEKFNNKFTKEVFLKNMEKWFNS
jgi:glycosyltransferase involved in cell wall biosynthesis